MPEILLKDKLTTLEDIGEALNSNIIVTGVKGSAEGSYRKGLVDLTPANIGAVSKTGNDTIAGALTISKDSQGYQDRIHFSSPGVSGECVIFGSTTGTVQRFTFRQVNSAGTKYEDYVLPNSAEYNGNSTQRNILTDKNVITIPQGGTGATTPAGAQKSLGIYLIPHDTVVVTDANGRATIPFSKIGISSRPSVCFVQTTTNYIRPFYDYESSSSGIVIIFYNAANNTPMANIYQSVFGVAFA